MGFSDYVVSVIRTVVPVWVGSFLAWVAAATGVVLDSASSAGAVTTVVALLVGVYYLAARALEAKWPALGWLLGAPRPPAYARKGE